jgi:hypothetical protein
VITIGKVNSKIPLVRLYITLSEEVTINLMEVENSLKDKVANPGEIVKLKKMKNPFTTHNMGNQKEFHKKLRNKQEQHVEDKMKSMSILKTLKGVLEGDKGERFLCAEKWVERLASCGWTANPDTMGRWFEEDKYAIDADISKRFVGNHEGFGVANIEYKGSSDLSKLDLSLRKMNDTLALNKNLTLEAQKLTSEAWTNLKKHQESSANSTQNRVEGSSSVIEGEAPSKSQRNSEFSQTAFELEAQPLSVEDDDLFTQPITNPVPISSYTFTPTIDNNEFDDDIPPPSLKPQPKNASTRPRPNAKNKSVPVDTLDMDSPFPSSTSTRNNNKGNKRPTQLMPTLDSFFHGNNQRK